MLTEKEIDVLRRRARGESQQEIAKSLGITQAAISTFERNAHRKILEAEHALGLAKKLGIKVAEGLGGKRVIYGGGAK